MPLARLRPSNAILGSVGIFTEGFTQSTRTLLLCGFRALTILAPPQPNAREKGESFFAAISLSFPATLCSWSPSPISVIFSRCGPCIPYLDCSTIYRPSSLSFSNCYLTPSESPRQKRTKPSRQTSLVASGHSSGLGSSC